MCREPIILTVLIRVISGKHRGRNRGKGGAMGLQPHLIFRVLHKILIFTIEIFSIQ